MRYHDLLNELKMSPSALAKFAKTTSSTIIGGFEAECILADVRDDEHVPDYSADERFGHRIDMEEVEQFFDAEVRTNAGMKNLNRQYEDWKEAKANGYVEENLESMVEQLAYDYNRTKDEDNQLPNEEFVEDAKTYLRDNVENQVDMSLHQFFWEYGHITDWREISDNFDIEWPHLQSAVDKGDFDQDIAEDAAEELRGYLSRPVKVNADYHGERKDGFYHMEPDGSVTPEDATDMGVEIISPPMNLDEMMADLESVMRFIDLNAYTNDSTGLHINLSIPNTSVDYTKLVLFLGDQHVLQQFGRQASDYARSSLIDLQNKASRGEATRAFDLLQQGLLDLAGKAVRDRNLNKKVSVNMHDSYVEFRAMGGDYITQWSDVKNNILRFARALEVACDPMAERKEYALKLYKLLTSSQRVGAFTDAVQVFSLYNGGVLPKEQMVDYLRQRKLNRD